MDKSSRLIMLYSGTCALDRMSGNVSVGEIYQYSPIAVRLHDFLSVLGLFETLQIIEADKIAAALREIIEQ